MSDTTWQDEVARRVVTPQIIVGCFLAASIGFLAVAAVLVHQDVTQPDDKLAWAMNLVLVFFLVNWIENQFELMERERNEPAV